MINKVDKLHTLFTPLTIGTLTLKNRVMFPAFDDVSPKDKLLELLISIVKGGPGLVIIPRGSIMRDAPEYCFHMYSDRSIPELSEFAMKLHSLDTAVGIQLTHEGRQSHYPDTPLAPSPISWAENMRMPKELTEDAIENIIENFSDGVRRARDAGLDIAEFHGAHGYLIGQFLSARSNKRKDRYGGDIRNRSRFIYEILRRSRQKVGDSYPICVRLNVADYIEGGTTIEETVETARIIEQAGASLINLSAGVYGYPVTIPSLYSQAGLNVEMAARIKKAVNIPVCVAGRIDSVQLAERILSEDKSDMVAIVRPFLADPELLLKAERGEFNRIRPCLYCNNGCMAPIEARKQISPCTVNPLFDKKVKAAAKIKKVVVIGGGVAGLEAARVSSSRGHRVVLYEKTDKPGGQWILAAVPPAKETFLQYLEWLTNEVKLSGVEIKLNSTATVESIKEENPDAVILASGALPAQTPVKGAENAIDAWHVLQGKADIGLNVLIAGGNATGLELAHMLAVQGRKVTVIELTGKMGIDIPRTARWHLNRLLNEHGVRLLPLTRLIQVNANGNVIVETKKGKENWSGYSTVILATGVRPCNALKPALEKIFPELYVVGDAVQPGSGLEAIAEGARAGLQI